METNRPAQHTTAANPKGTPKWLYILIALLIAGNIFFLIRYNNTSKERDAAIEELNTFHNQQTDLQDDFNAALARLDMLTSEMTERDSVISEKNEEINQLKSEIKRLLAQSKLSNEDRSKARALIAQLNEKIKTYEERIATLEFENQALSSSNDSLKTAHFQQEQLNKELQYKISEAALIELSNIRLQAIDVRRSGKKEKSTSKAKKADFLRIVFDVEKNRLAEDAMNDLYIVIHEPGGKLLSNAAYGSGVIEDQQGNTIPYTLKKQVPLKPNEMTKDVVVDWYQENDYLEGEYRITIFNKGLVVGQSLTRLK